MSQGQNLKSSWAVMAHASDPNIKEAETGGEIKANLVYWAQDGQGYTRLPCL